MGDLYRHKLLSESNKVGWYILNSVTEERNFLFNISIEKGPIPIKVSNCPSDKFIICLFKLISCGYGGG